MSEVIAITRIGESAGLILRYVGGPGRLIGRSLEAALMAACTSRAAESTVRSRSNWMVTDAPPSVLIDVISETPEIWLSRFSNGAASDEATVSGSAPGREAVTMMTGKSTRGSAATGRKW